MFCLNLVGEEILYVTSNRKVRHNECSILFYFIYLYFLVFLLLLSYTRSHLGFLLSLQVTSCRRLQEVRFSALPESKRQNKILSVDSMFCMLHLVAQSRNY